MYMVPSGKTTLAVSLLTDSHTQVIFNGVQYTPPAPHAPPPLLYSELYDVLGLAEVRIGQSTLF